MPPVHAANLVASSGNTPYGVDVIADITHVAELLNIDRLFKKMLDLSALNYQ